MKKVVTTASKTQPIAVGSPFQLKKDSTIVVTALAGVPELDHGAAEAADVLGQLAERTGPFDPRWESWSPPEEWGTPAMRTAFPHGLALPPGAAIDEELLKE